MQNQTMSNHRETLDRSVFLFRRFFRLFFLAVLKCTVVSRIGFLGTVPDILLAYLVLECVLSRETVLHTRKRVSVNGIVAGFLSDALGGVGYGLLALFYFLCGSFCPQFFRKARGTGVREELTVYYLCLLPTCALRAVVTLIGAYLYLPSFSLPMILLSIILPEYVGTLLFALPVWAIFRRRVGE